MKLVVYGAGELGGRVVETWGLHGSCLALTATPRRHQELARMGADTGTGAPGERLGRDDVLLIALAGNRAQLAAVRELSKYPAPSRAVFVSSTGYYGTTELRRGTGAVIDEETPGGRSERAQEVAEAEDAFRAWAGAQGVILRLGGLYRPGRGPFSALVRRQSAPGGAPDRTLALIHYEDAASAAATALTVDRPASVYVGVVPPCPSRRAFYRAACAKAKLAPPRFDLTVDEPRVTYDTSRLTADLLPSPAFPDWRASLV